MTNLDSAVLIFVIFCDNKWGVVNLKPVKVRNFEFTPFLRSATILLHCVESHIFLSYFSPQKLETVYARILNYFSYFRFTL